MFGLKFTTNNIAYMLLEMIEVLQLKQKYKFTRSFHLV